MIFASLKTCTPSRLVGMLAPSLTAMQPFLTSILASSPSSSFCVAHGKATSHGTPHGVLPGVKVAVLNSSQYSSIRRSEEHTSELQSLMRISYAVFCLKKKNKKMTKITAYQ